MINQNSEFLQWKELTKELLEKYPALELYNEIENCIVELSDEQWFEHKWTKEDLVMKPEVSIGYTKKKGVKRKLIDEKLNILQVPKLYCLQIKNNKIECPYHYDEEPSCHLNKETNTFHCFGCGKSGDIIELNRKLKEVINGRRNKQEGI